jgi:pyridoxal phosphate enzyme (YggS family)
MKTLKAIYDELAPYQAQLIAVSKTHPPEAIQAFYDQGHRAFGENKPQELAEKAEHLPDDIQWHMIGHLQTNKVKYIAPFVHMIHSLDRIKLLKEIEKRAAQAERVIPCLLQLKIAEEDSKFGLSFPDARELLMSTTYQEAKHIKICGVMGMATFTDDQNQVRKEFQRLKQYFDTLKEAFFAQDEDFSEISMGMSGDYPLALEEGSTMVRIGSLLFGSRNYG